MQFDIRVHKHKGSKRKISMFIRRVHKSSLSLPPEITINHYLLKGCLVVNDENFVENVRSLQLAQIAILTLNSNFKKKLEKRYSKFWSCLGLLGEPSIFCSLYSSIKNSIRLICCSKFCSILMEIPVTFKNEV